ncbi:MAG: hypothetical protein ACFFDN_52205 [Candidatus Hodarchaeota archaeon]
MTEIDFRYLFICFLWDIFWAFMVNAFFGLFATPLTPMFGVAEGRNFFSAESLFMDVFWMNLYSGFFIVLFVTTGTREDMKRGKVETPSWNRKSIPVLKYLPKYMLIRGFVFSVICLLIFFPIGLLALLMLEVESLTYWNFVIMKGLYGIIISIPTALIVRISALGDGPKLNRKTINGDK